MEFSADYLNNVDSEHLPGDMGIRVLELGDDYALLELKLDKRHMDLNGYAHGGAIAALADTTAGYPTYTGRPEESKGFTTSEFKLNFLRPALAGDTLRCRSKLINKGRSNWIWDATVFNPESGKNIAEYRCTNIILY